MSYYLHSVPGRLRIKSPAIKGRPEAAAGVQVAMAGIEGVEAVTINPLTGSIVVTHEAVNGTRERILDALMRMGHFEASKAVTHDQYIKDKASKAGKVIGRVVMGTFVEKAFEGSALSLLALLI